MILITGGCGYIGSHIVKHLQQNNIPIVVVDNLSTGHRESVTNCTVCVGDIGNPVFLNGVFAKYKIDAVIHFAAVSLVAESEINPDKYWLNNVDNGLVLLETMIRNDCKKIVFSSTAAVYGEPENIPITEDMLKNPVNVYGKTKFKFEELLAEFEKNYGLRHISLRYFNACGADESGHIGEDHKPESHLIPLVLKVPLGKREYISIFGTNYSTKDGTCIRDYVHVTDLAEAHLLAVKALENGWHSTVYNLGNGQGFSVREVIETARKVTGHPIPAIESDRRVGDPAILIANYDKIRQELGWSPKYISLEKIIESAWRWHSNHPEGYAGSKAR